MQRPLIGAAIASLLVACASRSPQPKVAADASPPFTITVTEPDPTVSMATGPLVFAAGPATITADRSSVRCPAGMALVGGSAGADSVCVDRWEATLVRLVNGVEEPWSPFHAIDSEESAARRFEFVARSREGVVPQGYVSGRQAELACRSAGKRLCTLTEWERGCRGPQGHQFPYGEERRAHTCNDDVRARHPVIEATNARGIFGDKVWLDGMNLSEVNQLPETLLPTGAREACVTEEGLFDMVGNLHEWVADADGTFRGGFYMDTTHNGDGCSYRTTAHDFNYHDYSTGFRCCADPESVE
jgi:formylglycine-generating enzyme